MITRLGKRLIVMIVFITIAVVGLLILRFIAMKKQKRKLRSDDIFAVMATVNMLIWYGTGIWGICNGVGAHAVELSLEQLSVQFKLVFATSVTWTLSTAFCKLAILRFYLVVFPSRRFRYVTFAVMGATFVYAGVLIPLFIFSCKPVQAAWDPLLHTEKCWDWRYHSIASTSSNLFIELVIVCMPLPLIWNLKMRTKKKVTVSVMFSMGLVVIAASLWRMITTIAPSQYADFSYDLYLIAVQSSLEGGFGLVAANLPVLAPLLPILVPVRVKKYFSKYSSGSAGQRITLKTFGSGGRNKERKDNFDILTEEDAASDRVELTPGQAGRNHGISMQHDIEVSVASRAGSTNSKARSPNEW
ncbi:hypothetical protein DM02DRAFT_601920 [Periconia macrospinosa]|uniref:Rhodopsin domain-containing protein n=1 Tax=Periconia macrospinosa TaxID=97972 RepID=A0A2V1D9I4_9PLEO|nr:hypothetical protein DM02DRAFT_601920 [Periconia macrospinosa]